MTKAEYPYPPDEFDEIVAGPRGAHRTPRSRWSRLWPFLLVLVLFPALAFGVVTYWSSDRGGADQAGALDPGADASATEGSADPAETPAQTPTETPTEAPVVPPTDEPVAPDLTTPVVVYNATNRSGLAAAAASKLEDAGWTKVTSRNYTGAGLATSTVLYSSPELETSARAAADELGISAVQAAESDATAGLEVVLEEDAP